MTVQELANKFNNEFGLDKWEAKYEVDAETYANVCQFIFNRNTKLKMNGIIDVHIVVGPNNGVLFKNVELIYKGE